MPALKSFSTDDVSTAAYLSARAGLDSIAEIQSSLPLNRKYFLQDIHDEDLRRRDLLI